MANFVVSGTPHVRSKESIQSIMRDVIIALVPATAAGIYYFGLRALILIVAAIISAVSAQLYGHPSPQFPQQLICKIFASFATESLYFGFLPSACNSCAISFNLLAVFSTTCV